MYQVRTAFKLLEKFHRDSSSGRVFWLHRVFKGGVDEDQDFKDSDEYKKKDYDDSIDPRYPEVKDHLDKLIAWMKGKFGSGEVCEYGEVSFLDCVNNTAVWKDQLQLMSNDVYNVLETSLQGVISSRREWMADSGGLCVPGAVGVEILHHCDWARQKCEDFIGRTELVEEGVRRILESRATKCTRRHIEDAKEEMEEDKDEDEVMTVKILS